MVAVAAVVAASWAVHDSSGPGRLTTTAQVCAVAAQVAASLDGSSVADRAALGARAAELADVLSRAEPSGADPGTASAIVAVLGQESATVAELTDALAPVLELCDQPLPGG